MRRAQALLLTLSSCSIADVTGSSSESVLPASPYPAGPRWKLAWSDEFEGPKSREENARCFSGRAPKCAYGTNDYPADCRPEDVHTGLRDLNRCNWTILSDYNYWSNHTSTFASDQVRVENGELVLGARTAFAAPHDCGTPLPDAPWLFTSRCPYAVGGVIGRRYTGGPFEQPGFQMRYGRFEVRGRVSSGPGSFPAYWMLPQDGAWPDGGEIDIMEYVHARTGQAVFTLHGRDGRWHSGHGTWLRPSNEFARTIVDEHHTWAVEWEPGEIRAYFDNREVRKNRTGQLIDDVWDDDTCRLYTPEGSPFYFILNDGITTFSGGEAWANADWNRFTHREGRIDYVRAWSRCERPEDYCPRGGSFDGVASCRGTSSYPSPCVESTLSTRCPNPCLGVGRFDGYNCFLRSAPARVKLYEKNGRFRYKRNLGFTFRGDCASGDAFISALEGCDAGPIPPGRRSFEYGQNYYVSSTCSVTADPPLCTNPCPWGGSFDGANCYLASAPSGTAPFIYERAFYYAAVRGHPSGPCPYAVGSYPVRYDGANCHIGIPIDGAANLFIHERNYYFQACGATPDFQRIDPARMGATYDEPSCSAL